MSGLSHYLQSRTQSIPITEPTQSNSLQSKTQSAPISESTQQQTTNMQKQQSVMFVLPTEDAQQHSNECRDDCDETASTSSSSTSRTRRDHNGDAIPEKSNVYLLHTSNSMIEMKTSSTGAMTYDTSPGNSPRRRTQSTPVSPLRTHEHFDSDNDDDFIDTGFASHAANACVACSIPVLHFIQFFMC